MNKGITYIAFGKKYISEAIHSAKSVKLHNPDLSICIFTDCEIKSPYFDSITVIKPSHRRPKVDYLFQSPYEYTLYLDSDTEVLSDISQIFDVLEKFDLAAAYDHNRKRTRPSTLIPAYDAIPYTFPEFNSGVLAFRKTEETQRFFHSWQEHFYRYQEESHGLDQPSFRIALWNSNLRLHVLPFEFNVRDQKLLHRLDKTERDFLSPRIFHWHGLDRPRLFSAWRKRRKAMKA